MKKHTPGPWTLQRYEEYTGYSIWAGDRGCIAEKWYPEAQNTKDHGLELVANARLIAAAPTLKFALEALVGKIEADQGQSLDIANALKWPAYRQALEAIAKADGK